MSEPKTMYQVMGSALKKDFIPSESEYKLISSFMLCRWLGNNPISMEVANYINSNYTMPIEAQYWLARSLVKNIKFIQIPKKEKEDLFGIEYISKYYKCNSETAKRYKKMMPEEEVQKIVDMYTKHGKVK